MSKQQWIFAAAILAGVIVVQWFVVNLAVALTTFDAHDRLRSGFRTALFLTPLDAEAAVAVIIGQVQAVLIMGIQYLAGKVTWRVMTEGAAPKAACPHWRILKTNGIWMLYWPMCGLLLAGGSDMPSRLGIFGGVFVIPFVLAVIAGAVAAAAGMYVRPMDSA